MIVVGVDPHKATHTAAAIASLTGELRGELTVKARDRGHEELLDWARGLDRARLFALEAGGSIAAPGWNAFSAAWRVSIRASGCGSAASSCAA